MMKLEIPNRHFRSISHLPLLSRLLLLLLLLLAFNSSLEADHEFNFYWFDFSSLHLCYVLRSHDSQGDDERLFIFSRSLAHLK